MNRVVIGVGSNICPEENISRLRQIFREAFPEFRESTFVETEPIGRPDQENYLNGAILIETTQSQEELTTWLQQIEARLGRVRTSDKYAARTMDLDILVWNGEVVDPDVPDRWFLREAIQELEG
jgi:2-amino-4-hydroxy-6-hydroxymethyldihydropteridine diphosphokinase